MGQKQHKSASSMKIADVKTEVNKLGKYSKPEFKFVFLAQKYDTVQKNWLVLVYSPFYKDKKWARLNTLRKKHHPFRQSLDIQDLAEKVNSLGKNREKDARFFFVAAFRKRYCGEIRTFITVRSERTKETRTIQMGHLFSKNSPVNPFGRDYHETNVVQPKFKNLLEKLGGQVECEVKISKKSRVDFVYTNSKGRKIIIEVKSDIKRHTSSDLETQISRYKQEGKKKYGNKYLGTFLVSEKGTYGYSMKELKTLLISRNLL